MPNDQDFGAFTAAVMEKVQERLPAFLNEIVRETVEQGEQAPPGEANCCVCGRQTRNFAHGQGGATCLQCWPGPGAH